MAVKFGGFTDQQREVLARRMGFAGPMEKFGEYLQSSPEYQNKFVSYENKARQLVEGKAPPVPGFAEGGVVSAEEQYLIDNPDVRASGFDPLKHYNLHGKGEGRAWGVKAQATAQPDNSQQAAVGQVASSGQARDLAVINNPTSITPQVTPTPIQTSPDQFINPASGQAAATPNVTASQVAPTAQAAAPAPTPAPQVTTASSAPAVASATAGMTAAKGTVSEGAKVEAVTALPSGDATVQGQLGKLMKQFEGGETPAWAAGAIRNANAIMAQRGLGASSIAGSAVTQAAMESAIQIAAQDAATFSQFEMTNLNNRQQARLINAQSFLQMDLANLDAEQQMTMFKSQSIVQSLFTDQAAENASRQFNATSQGQTDQFFANLKTQVSQFNVAQTNAMEQFKAGQTDSVSMFNRQMNDAREQFNAQNRLIVDQSNAEWRRAVTTADNASINEANRINATNASAMTQAAYNNLMQRERDFYSFAFTAGENNLSRANELALSQLGISSNESIAKKESKSNTWAAVGSLAASLISKW